MHDETAESALSLYRSRNIVSLALQLSFSSLAYAELCVLSSWFFRHEMSDLFSACGSMEI